VLSEEKKRELLALRERTNPLKLREEIYQLVEELFSLPNALPGVTEDVFQTLQCLQPHYRLVTLSFDLTRIVKKENNTR
jgi:hypothetical protein